MLTVLLLCTVFQDQTAHGDARTLLDGAHELALTTLTPSLDGGVPNGSPTGSSILLDNHPDATAAFSIRRISSSYSGPALRIRRSSDNSEQNIGFNSSGDLDLTALKSFVGNGDGFVSIWYDQSGNAAHLTSTERDRQPQLVSHGAVILDDEGLPTLEFDPLYARYLSATNLDQQLSNEDLTAFFVNRSELDDSQKILFALGTEDSKNILELRVVSTDAKVRIGDGNDASFENLGLIDPDNRSTWTLQLTPDRVRILRNHTHIGDAWHSYSPVTRSAFSIGNIGTGAGYAGELSEVLLFPALSDEDREAVYDNVNAYYLAGPLGMNAQAILPQAWQYQVDLYDWLETIDVSDVQLNHQDLRWDGSFANFDDLVDLWIEVGDSRAYLKPTMAIRSPAKWFVLDDGQGAGIEATGAVRHVRWGNNAAYWYQRSVPMAGGGQGNPYYNDPAVCRRALVMTAVDMMMTDMRHDVGHNDDPRFLGGSMNGWLYSYGTCKSIISADVQNAFESGFERLTDKLLLWGPNGHTPNMQTRAVAAFAQLYATTNKAHVKDKALRAARLFMFGYEDGVLESKHDLNKALFMPAGYVNEGGSPETTYNGVSLFHLLEARAATRDDANWAFMDEPLKRMLEFKTYQYFKDPAASLTGNDFFEGPSGYAGRTSKSYVRDQRGRPWRNVTAADMYEEGEPLIRFSSILPEQRPGDPDWAAASIYRGLTTFNDAGFGTVDSATPPVFQMDQQHHWPDDSPYKPNPGWYSRLYERAYVENARSTHVPFERPDYTFSKSFENDFWAYKSTSGSQSFGFFIESEADAGTYSGWYGGSLQSFWTEDAGILILTRKDKSGSELPKENSRAFSVIDKWGTNHVWGKDARSTPRAFTSATGRYHSVNYDNSSDPGSVTVSATLDPRKQETDDVISGSVKITNHFEATDNGILVRHTLTSDRVDDIKELWATIPVYLRDGRWESELSDTNIEYWDGSGWRKLGTTLVSTESVRLGRNFGGGLKYGYVRFAAPQRIKLSGSVWEQTYQADSRVRNIHIDLHGSPGSVIKMPASASVEYAITTTNPTDGSTPPPPGDPSGAEAQTLSLKQGWNLVSLTLSPTSTDLPTIFSGVSSQIALVKDERGQIYDPSFGIDAIGAWSRTEAYLVYAKSAVSINVEGERISPESTSIPLEEGWNLVPFLPNASLSVQDALSSISGDLVIAKDDEGRVYSPSLGVDAIGSMQPGRGYEIYVKKSTTLTYPTGG